MNKKVQILILLVMFIGHIGLAQTFSGRSNSVAVDYSTEKRGGEAEIATSEKKETIKDALRSSSEPTYHALIIGVSKYEYSGANLPNLDKPTKDAEELYSVLTTKYNFDPKNVTLLKDPNRETVIDTFHGLADIVTEKDNLMIFYAGHGYYDKPKDFGYWLPSDAKAESTANWIPNSTIKDYISAIPSKHTLLITDACFGGSIFKTRAVGGMSQLKVHELYKDRSRKAITSGSLTEVPDESFFVYMLIKTLDENEFDYLPASTVFARIYEPVMNNAPTVPQFGVIQGAGDEGGDFIFIRRK
ncbi:caspase family protein [Marivirga harenae]|uniref:caspase family protein n=1 Tax=Marivirga harenae TaxID=2010992 RepID=UPI0026E052DE|nr:caspase family protein [Marivirga harenae]WKV11482.1 caspase family protein [Marivirga harenae]|tara:strand:- start:51385 stop:52287 length:903 start_codon:yes stop_codon:yes gene_type:complete